MHTTRAVILAARPHGWPTEKTFEVTDVELLDLADGQVLVENVVMSVDPYMRGRMDDTESYAAPFQVGEPLDGGAVGRVVESRHPDLAVGDHVVHALGWREHAVLDGSGVQQVDVGAAPASAYLGILGMTGLTAYAGLLGAAGMRQGDAVFVSAAAGAVGSAVGQIAKQKGASRVIGSAGSQEKVDHLHELGFDAAFNYHDGDVARSLKKAAPGGIDAYFDNVGGEHLEAAIAAMNKGGRIAMCGAISQYNATEPACAPRNLAAMIGKGISMRGFLVAEYQGMRKNFLDDMTGWLRSGDITANETFRDGLDAAPQAFIDMMRGENTGKMVVRL